MGVACAMVSRSSWTSKFLDVVIWSIELIYVVYHYTTYINP